MNCLYELKLMFSRDCFGEKRSGPESRGAVSNFTPSTNASSESSYERVRTATGTNPFAQIFPRIRYHGVFPVSECCYSLDPLSFIDSIRLRCEGNCLPASQSLVCSIFASQDATMSLKSPSSITTIKDAAPPCRASTAVSHFRDQRNGKVIRAV